MKAKNKLFTKECWYVYVLEIITNGNSTNVASNDTERLIDKIQERKND